MTRSLPVQVVPRVAASAAAVFGVATVMAGGRVLLGGDPGYLVFRPLLLFNTVMGAVYLIAGALVWRGAPGGRRLAGAIALANAVVLVGISGLWFAGGPVAPDSVGAMAFRTLVWVAIWASLIWAGGRGLGAGGRLLLLLALGALLPTPGNGQARPTGNPEAADSEPPRPVPLPSADLFRPLLADPKQPQFAASYLWASSDRIETRVGAVAFGENFGIVRWPGARAGEGLQLSLAGGVFAQFDLLAESMDLMNADYVIGLPLTWRDGAVSARVRIYHQSSHLGDEYLLRAAPERVNLSFEAVEGLISATVGTWRAYGGGEVLVRREPGELGRGLLHAGIEYRLVEPVLRVGTLGLGRFVAGFDTKLWEQHDWSPAVSGKAGLEFAPAASGSTAGRRWSALIEGYNGPSPYGQFLTEDITYVGFGIYIGL